MDRARTSIYDVTMGYGNDLTYFTTRGLKALNLSLKKSTSVFFDRNTLMFLGIGRRNPSLMATTRHGRSANSRCERVDLGGTWIGKHERISAEFSLPE